MNCILPVSRNGELISNIKCSLNALLFPMIYINEIILPTEFPKIEEIEILNWDKIEHQIFAEICHQEFQLVFSNISSNEQNCKSKNETIISLLGSLKEKNNTYILNKTNYSFNLRSLINKDFKNISCEIYPNDRIQDYYQMDCNLLVNDNLEFQLYRIIVNDELSKTNIYINVNNSYQISECSKYNKFINFNGKIDMKSNLEKSLFELNIYSEIIGFEDEKKIQFNLNYPKYSIMDCIIPSSNNSNNNTFIKCLMDMNKYPLIKGDNIILPNNIFDKENCSITKWEKIKKNLEINFDSDKYSILFSSSEGNNITSCDDKGNNIIIIPGYVQTSKIDKNYNFNISGLVDGELKNLTCNLNILEGKSNETKCLAYGKNSSQIYQTKGVDSKENEGILIKVNNYLNYNLRYCSVSNQTTLVLAIVLPIVGLILIIGVVILCLKCKKNNPKYIKEGIEKLNSEKFV